MFISLVILAILIIANGIVMPSMLSLSSLSRITNGQLATLIASLGQTLVLLVGGIDLSVGGVICVINSLAAVAMPDSPVGIVLFCLLCIVIGLLIGAFNGYIVTKFNVQPFIVTFTVNYIMLGIAQLILDRDGGNPPKAFTKTEINRILTALDSGEYGKILRAKGIVNGEGGWIEFDYVPEEHEIRAGHADYTGRLCVIGANLNESKLAELFGL